MTKVTKSDKWAAFKEAVTDTAIGSVINVPLNFIMISLAFYWSLTALETTIFMTCVFTVLAIVRKMYIRLHFHKRYRKKENTANSIV